jgi:hypothetical protein
MANVKTYDDKMKIILFSINLSFTTINTADRIIGKSETYNQIQLFLLNSLNT